MIEAHVTNTFLAPTLRDGAWFGWVNYVNGLVAPAFLFIAGYAQGLGAGRGPRPWADVRRRLRRLTGIAAIGFALHLPWAQLAARQWADALRIGTAVDILPCLAVAIGVLVIVERLAGRWANAIVAVMTAAVLIVAPALADWTGAPVPVRRVGESHDWLAVSAAAVGGVCVGRVSGERATAGSLGAGHCRRGFGGGGRSAGSPWSFRPRARRFSFSG